MLTIVIPTKNRALQLEKLLPILLGDKFYFAKILIGYDEACIDNTEEVLQNYKHHNRLELYSVPMNIGSAGAAQFIFKYVKTDYLMFCTDDDLVDPKALEELFKLMQLNNAVLAFGKYKVRDNETIQELDHPGWAARATYKSDFLGLIAHDSYMFPVATIIKKSALPNNNYNGEDSPIDANMISLVNFDNLGEFRSTDWDLFLNISFRYPNQIYFMNKYVATFVKTDGQMTSESNFHQTGRAAVEMALLLLKYLSIYDCRNLLASNPVALDSALNLLAHKANQITTKSHINDIGYMPLVNAAKILLLSLRNSSL
jgi:glycosyltransferase involved in cell wall biosynthesis